MAGDEAWVKSLASTAEEVDKANVEIIVRKLALKAAAHKVFYDMLRKQGFDRQQASELCKYIPWL